MFLFARKNLDPKWHFFQEKLPHIVIYQSYKNRAGVKMENEWLKKKLGTLT
jgi:hypothetical protein